MPRHRSALSSKFPTVKFDFNDPKFKPNFAQVAELIVRSPPPWLPAFLEWSAQDLYTDRMRESYRQTKAQTKKRLASLRDAARLILHELDSYPFRDFLEMEPLGLIRDTSSLRLALRDIEDRAVRSAALPVFTKETGETRSGRVKALAPDHVSARVLCAARTAELWLFFHDVEPGPKGPRAAEFEKLNIRPHRGQPPGHRYPRHSLAVGSNDRYPKNKRPRNGRLVSVHSLHVG